MPSTASPRSCSRSAGDAGDRETPRQREPESRKAGDAHGQEQVALLGEHGCCEQTRHASAEHHRGPTPRAAVHPFPTALRRKGTTSSRTRSGLSAIGQWPLS